MRSTTSSSFRRVATLALAATLVAGTVALVAAPAGAIRTFSLQRISGTDRYATAAAIATNTFTTAPTVIVATGEDYPDALAGNFLAGAAEAPVLLTRPFDVPQATLLALAELEADEVILLGGEAVISQAVFERLDRDYTVTRIAGENRYDTAREVATAGHVIRGGTVGTVDGDPTAIVAFGRGYADALAAGALAYGGGLPILLTEQNALPTETSEAIVDLGIEHVVIAGGTAVVSARVENDLKSLGVTVARVFGADRYATSTALAEFAITELGFVKTHVELARGDDFPSGAGGFADGLAGGPHAGEDGPAPILLTSGNALSTATRTFLELHADTLATGHVFGGAAAVSDPVKAAAEAAARLVGAEIVQVETADPTTTPAKEGNFYVFVAKGKTSSTKVTYASTDNFVVDGESASISGFESLINPGDRIIHTPATSTGAAAKHELINVDPTTINGRTIGNVDTADNQFDFISDVTGDWVRRNVTYADNSLLFVDGAPAAVVDFEKHISEGDIITISATADGTRFDLANRSVTGIANTIDKPDTGLFVDLKVGPFGDKPEASSDSSTDRAGPGNDDRYRATSADAFAGDASNYTEFRSQITDGDQVTYTRVGGVQTFTIVNAPLPTVRGFAVGEVIPDSDGDPTNNSSDGGTMTLKVDGANKIYRYIGSGAFYVNGLLAGEAGFEAAYDDGDTVVYRPADPAAGQTQRIELTDKEKVTSSGVRN